MKAMGMHDLSEKRVVILVNSMIRESLKLTLIKYLIRGRKYFKAITF